jgi:hypothetical protein
MKSGGESPRFFWGGGERWGVPIEKNKEYGIIKDMPELSRFLGIVIAWDLHWNGLDCIKKNYWMIGT